MTRPAYQRVVAVEPEGRNIALTLECGCVAIRGAQHTGAKRAVCDTHHHRFGE